jgi:uncharacterized protein YndB with AHSA1/START domain
MDTPATPTGQQPTDRPAKRHRVAAVFISLFALLLIVLTIRGTWADQNVRNPASSAEGTITQLYLLPDGHKQVRCAVMLDCPLQEVWKTLTDYEHFRDVFPFLIASETAPEPGGRQHLKETISSFLGDWQFEISITHTETPEKCVASWDQPGGDLSVNRGSWTLTAAGAGKTLAVYVLEAEVRRFPAFAVRNVLLSYQRDAPVALSAWLKKKHAR